MDLTSAETVEAAVAEIMRINRSLPPRAGLEEVEAARAVIENLEKEDQARLEAIGRQSKGRDVSEELFSVLQEMQRSSVLFQSNLQKSEAKKILDLERLHSVCDGLIQRASLCVSASNGSGKASFPAQQSLSAGVKSGAPLFSQDDSFVKKSKANFLWDGIRSDVGVFVAPQIVDSSLKLATNLVQGGEKLSLIKLASLIGVSLKKGTKEVNLQNKLVDQMEWLPDSIGKLSSLLNLDLSENRIMVLPATIGGLSSLTRLDLHSNRIAELPEPIGDLLNLVFLDLRGNQLLSLPASIGRLARLEEIDLSSNRLSSLPDSLGSLISLKVLNVETNDIDELPYTIGQCSSLQELHADYNRLKALPEAVGRIASLEILSVRYNNIRLLPTTMESLTKLRELDVSFNELELVPDSLCFATSLVKMNIGNNFADLRSLPKSIGNLEKLEELDMSNNQIRNLPESFRLLARLRVLRVEENPLEIPPRHIAENGAIAVVQYMADLAKSKDMKPKTPTANEKRNWAQKCFFSMRSKRKLDNVEFLKE